MQFRNRFARAIASVRALCVLLIASTVISTRSNAQAVSVDGVLTAVASDRIGQPGSATIAIVTTPAGIGYTFDPQTIGLSEAAVLRLSGQNVRVTGSLVTPLVVGAPETSRVLVPSGLTPLQGGFGRLLNPPVVTGAQPWVIVGCRFADDASTPSTATLWQKMLGTVSPGLDHYWREVSNNTATLTGSAGSVWVNLPSPRATYVTASGNNLAKIATDCAAAADSSVTFTAFTGIVFQLNGTLPCSVGIGSGECSFGAYSPSNLTTDGGQTKAYRLIWNTRLAAGYQSTVAHEMGHTFGLAHSGNIGDDYDSHWDVMSYGQVWSGTDLGYVAVHTNAYYKYMLGWIPSSRAYIATVGSSQQIALERSAQPVSGSNKLIALIPIANRAGHSYVIEYRQAVGYDVTTGAYGLPSANGAVIHEVIENGSNNYSYQVTPVDADGNGDPNDAGATWVAGETFSDAANGVTVTFDGSASSTAILVTVTLAGNFSLTVGGSGLGAGKVVSNTGGINCTITTGSTSGSCGGAFAPNSSVTLTATPNAGSVFQTWGGDCGGRQRSAS